MYQHNGDKQRNGAHHKRFDEQVDCHYVLAAPEEPACSHLSCAVTALCNGQVYVVDNGEKQRNESHGEQNFYQHKVAEM